MCGMWHLKIRYKHTDCVYTGAVTRLGLHVQYYTINSYRKGNYIYATSLQIVRGKNAAKYFHYLEKNDRIANVERHKNVFFVQAKHQRKGYEKIYTSEIFNPSPSIIGDGVEIIELASWDRKPLAEILKGFQSAKDKVLCELIFFENKKPEGIFITKVLPELPPAQKKALYLARSMGYYSYPRKTNLDELAKIQGVSKSTFRENLRKAEAKLLPQLMPAHTR